MSASLVSTTGSISSSRPAIDMGTLHCIVNPASRDRTCGKKWPKIIEKLQDIDGRLGYYNLAPIVAKTFKIMGISSYSEIYESKEEALTGIIS